MLHIVAAPIHLGTKYIERCAYLWTKHSRRCSLRVEESTLQVASRVTWNLWIGWDGLEDLIVARMTVEQRGVCMVIQRRRGTRKRARVG